jgi:hypothetical protein
MKNFFAILVMLAGVVGGLYVGAWLMFIKPIIEACLAFDTGTLTGLMVGTTILKCIFAGTVGGLIYYIGVVIGYWLMD